MFFRVEAEPESPHDVATGEGDGATSKEKVFRKQRCLRNSSQKERNATATNQRRCSASRALAWLLSVGDGSRASSKEKVFRN